MPCLQEGIYARRFSGKVISKTGRCVVSSFLGEQSQIENCEMRSIFVEQQLVNVCTSYRSTNDMSLEIEMDRDLVCRIKRASWEAGGIMTMHDATLNEHGCVLKYKLQVFLTCTTTATEDRMIAR